MTLRENEVAVASDCEKVRKLKKTRLFFLTLIVRSVNTKLCVLAIAGPVSIFLCCVMAEKTPRKKVTEYITYACRCCNIDTNAHDIRFHLFGKKSSNEGLVDAIKQLSGIVVSKEDELSQYICRICARNITNLHKKVTEFKKKCVETAKKQREQFCSIREKRGRKDDYGDVEKSPLPEQPAKRAFVERRVAQSLEERFKSIAPKPGPLSLPAPLPTTVYDPFGQDEVQVPRPNAPLEQLPLAEELAIISKSGLQGIKVCLKMFNFA